MTERLLRADWSRIILTICGAKKMRLRQLARFMAERLPNTYTQDRAVHAVSVELGRLARLEALEPRISLGIHLLEIYDELGGSNDI